jgi:hypothetical protein
MLIKLCGLQTIFRVQGAFKCIHSQNNIPRTTGQISMQATSDTGKIM